MIKCESEFFGEVGMIPYKLGFRDISEIRMGSPFNKAVVTLTGSFIPSLEGHEFQDVGVVFDHGERCALCQWDLVENEPRFKIWIIDQKSKGVSISQPIDGACISIEQLNGELTIKTWSFDALSKKGITRDLAIKL